MGEPTTSLPAVDHVCPYCKGTGQLKNRTNDPARILARFNKKWMPDGARGCWVWMAYRNVKGYGVISAGSRKGGHRRRPLLAHRVAYELLKGPIPAGLVLDHLCRNTYCVNPDHLEPVTLAENTARGDGPRILRERFISRTHCPSGHPYSGSNLYMRPDGSRGCQACIASAGVRYRTRRFEAST
jgi:hypothetical protein